MNKTASETTVCKLREEAPRLRLRKRVNSRHLPSHWCRYSCVCRCVHTYLAWWKPEGGISCSVLYSVYLFAFRQGLLMNWNMMIWLDWPPFSISNAGVAGTYHHTYIVVVCPSVYFVLFSLHILTVFFTDVGEQTLVFICFHSKCFADWAISPATLTMRVSRQVALP